MLQDLIGMECLDNDPVEPSRFGRQGRGLLREFTKGVLVLLGSTAVDGHRLLECRIVGRDEEALFSGDDKHLIAHIQMETVSQILGEGGADGATHLSERDSTDHEASMFRT